MRDEEDIFYDAEEEFGVSVLDAVETDEKAEQKSSEGLVQEKENDLVNSAPAICDSQEEWAGDTSDTGGWEIDESIQQQLFSKEGVMGLLDKMNEKISSLPGDELVERAKEGMRKTIQDSGVFFGAIGRGISDLVAKAAPMDSFEDVFDGLGGRRLGRKLQDKKASEEKRAGERTKTVSVKEISRMHREIRDTKEKYVARPGNEAITTAAFKSEIKKAKKSSSTEHGDELIDFLIDVSCFCEGDVSEALLRKEGSLEECAEKEFLKQTGNLGFKMFCFLSEACSKECSLSFVSSVYGLCVDGGCLLKTTLKTALLAGDDTASPAWLEKIYSNFFAAASEGYEIAVCIRAYQDSCRGEDGK